MEDEFLPLLQKHAQKVRRENEEWQAAKAAYTAEKREWSEAWNYTYEALHGSHGRFDLSPILRLGKVLRNRGFDKWLPDMAANFSKLLDDPAMYRPGQLIVARVLIVACRPRATARQLHETFASFQPDNPPNDQWAANAAQEIHDFIGHRIVGAEKRKEADEKEAAAKAAADRRKSLHRAASRRTAIHKQLFAVHWTDQGLGPAAIRDKWNLLRPNESVGNKRSGRHDITIAIQRGREFLKLHATTPAEVAAILGISL
jgi:hypothetical protein